MIDFINFTISICFIAAFIARFIFAGFTIFVSILAIDFTLAPLDFDEVHLTLRPVGLEMMPHLVYPRLAESPRRGCP